MSGVVMTVVRNEEDDRRDAESRAEKERVQAEEEPVKAVFDRVAAEAKRLLRSKSSGLLGFFKSTPSDAEQLCIADAIDIICRASFRQWRADKRGKKCPDRFGDEGVSEEICSVVESRLETTGGSMLDIVKIHGQAASLVQQAYSKLNP